MTQRQTVCVVVALIVTVLGFMAFGLWAATSHANSPVIFPEGVTTFMDGQSIPFRVYSQCDEKRHNLIYATVASLVIVKGGC